MLTGITGIDHVGIDPVDVWQAFAKYTRLGFTVSTPGRFFGLPVESCQITFPDKFLSISTSTADPTRVDTEWVTRTKPAGITELMFGTRDIQQVKAELTRKNPGMLEGHAQAEAVRQVFVGSRNFQQNFLILVLDPAKVEGVGTIGFCQHATPENVFRSELLSHPNGAKTLSGVTFLHTDPVSLEPFYSQLLGESSGNLSDGRYVRMVGGFQVEFLTEGLLRGRVPKFKAWKELRASDLKIIRFGVEDLERTKDYFEFMGIDHFEQEQTIYVGPSDARGFLLGFEQEKT